MRNKYIVEKKKVYKKMKFSEYVMNESLDEGIKDKLKDAAIKIGAKLGSQKAKSVIKAKEDKERRERKSERDAARRTKVKIARESKAKALAQEIEKASREAVEIVKKACSPLNVHMMPFNSDLALRHAKTLVKLSDDRYDGMPNFNVSPLTGDGKTIPKPSKDEIAKIKDAIYNKAFDKLKEKWYVHNMWYHEPVVCIAVVYKG